MKSEANHPFRKAVRLPNFDYAQSAAYFVTIVTHQRLHLFGEVRDGEMLPNQLGMMVAVEWQAIADHYRHVIVDEFVVMPNHLHGILMVSGGPRDTASCVTTRAFGEMEAGSLSSIVRSFKSGMTRKARLDFAHVASVWQPNFYEHIVRNETDLEKTREYIRENPRSWELDRERLTNLYL